MVILEFYQNDYSKDIVAFDSIKEGKIFVAQIPGYTLETEDGFEVEFFNPTNLQTIWKLSITETLYLCLNLCLILRKMLTLFGKKSRIYPNQTKK